MKRILNTEKGPKAIGPYSQGVEINSMLFISGQIALDPATNKIIEGGIEEQTHQVFRNLGGILSAAGYNFYDIVKTTVILTDINNFSKMNAVYAQYFEKDFPARTTFQASLPPGVLIQLEAIAVKQRDY